MMAMTPGDPVQIMLGDSLSDPAQVAALRHDMGLDLPVLARFVRFLGNAVTGDFGLSYFHRRPVLDVIADRSPATVELTIAASVQHSVTEDVPRARIGGSSKGLSDIGRSINSGPSHFRALLVLPGEPLLLSSCAGSHPGVGDP